MKTIKRFLLVLSFIMILSCGRGRGGMDEDTSVDVVKLKEPQVGLSLFPLNNVNFPVDEAIDLLKATKPGYRATFSILYRSFGESMVNYQRVIEEIKDLRPHVQIHVICGPCRKPRASGSLEKFFPELTIDQLNKRIVSDPSIVEAYKRTLLDIKNNYVIPSPELTFAISPELESNLTRQAAGILINAVTEVFADSENVEVVFNPLDNKMRFEGIPFELHQTRRSSTAALRKGDYLNFDGSIFLYEDEQKPQGAWRSNNVVKWDEIQETIKSAVDRGSIVYLWRSEWQGLHVSPRPAPDKREYTFWNRHEEIKFLLNVVEEKEVVLDENGNPIENNEPKIFIEKAPDGPDNFLWKPISESNGNLVVLLPTWFRGTIEKFELHRSDAFDSTSLIERGRFAGDTMNGDRVHYRFNRPGSGYGRNIRCVAFALDGNIYVWNIPDGSRRVD